MKPIKILLLGKNGQVGWELQRTLSALGDLVSIGRPEADFSRPEILCELLNLHRPDVIVNAAAYTAVDKAESEPEPAFQINAEAVGVLAQEAARLNAWLVHYSTDYVFDGQKSSPYNEEDETCPLSVYGKSKREGENRIREYHPGRHLIFRTSWVYSARGANFAKTMLRLFKERDSLQIVADQIGAPTSAELIADVTALSLHRIFGAVAQDMPKFSGTYHLAASGCTSWHGYAEYLLELAQAGSMPLKANTIRLQPIATEAYPLPAVRPRNSRLDTTKLVDTFALCLPDWRYHVRRLMDELSR